MTRRLAQLFDGLTLYGVSMAMMFRSGLGLNPWDVFHGGVARHLPLSMGTIVVLTAVLVLALWIPLRQAPGLGTVANAVWLGVALDLALWVLPQADALAVQVPLLLGGIVLNGLAGALYIGSQLGPGPRDGLMTGIARKTGGSLRVIRTGIEVVVVALGWVLGGTVGIGTILYALAIGPLVQRFMPFCIVVVDPPAPRRGQAPRAVDASRSRALGDPVEHVDDVRGDLEGSRRRG
ncbi:putative membrane protein YczE [Sanguibacter antarcticus]|uniref:Putative membrane protein YczE n=2 Tax=Sanguibacter antarcticus TaxID=372484 RepID=A0A2A9E1I2_9MICO|nr:putative membrane protein YczE [Sanguibacter antarcticus]